MKDSATDKFKMIMTFKSGKVYHFECDKYTLKVTGDNEISFFSFEGAIGECPIYFRGEDVESIARVV